MGGTKKGGLRAAETNRKRYGQSFYEKIGAKGGKRFGVRKGFAANLTLAAEAGRKGGRKSKRKKVEE